MVWKTVAAKIRSDRDTAESGLRRGRSGRLFALLISVALLGTTGPVSAQQDKPAPAKERPIVIVSAASVERLLVGLDTAFASGGRPELSDTVSGWMANANDLKGLNRDQPVGVMIFMSGLLPDVVAFVPVKNLADLMKTVEIGPVKTKKVSDDRYELTGPRQTFYVQLKGDYAYISNNTISLEREFPDPLLATRRTAASYDLSAYVDIAALPPTTRDIFLGFLRQQANADLQRRDGESAGAYEIRKSAGMSNLEAVERLLNEGQEAVIGWAVSPATKAATLEFVVQAMPGTDLAEAMAEFHTGRSKFSRITLNQSPLTMLLSWKLDKSGRKTLKQILSGAEKEMLGGLYQDMLPAEGEKNPIGEIMTVLQSTAEAGHLDMVFQVKGDVPGQYVLLAAAKVQDSAALSGALTSIMDRLATSSELSETKVNAATYRGTALHRIVGKNVGKDDEERYGGQPALYFGAGEGVLWVSIGGEGALPALREMMDEVAKPVPTDLTVAPLQFVANFSQVLDYFAPQNRDGAGRQRARDAFSRGGDSLRVDVRPLENGMKVRVQMDEAFLRLWATEVGRDIDRAERRRLEQEEKAKAEKAAQGANN